MRGADHRGPAALASTFSRCGDSCGGAGDEDLSGIDPRRDLQAETAVDLLSSMPVCNEREKPPFQKKVLIRGVWRDAGTT